MVKKGNQYRYEDEQGSYIVCFGERTIEIKIIGLLSKPLIKKYCDDLTLMLKVIEWPVWGYFGDLSECTATSPLALEGLVALHQRFLQQGCIVEAYTVNNPKVTKNIENMRKAAGITYYSLDNNIFENEIQALAFIHKVIEKHRIKDAQVKQKIL